MLSLLTGHGRTTPLVWLTVDTATLKNHRNEYEYRVLVRLADMLPSGINVCIVADRGFGDQKLYRVLTGELHFDYVIRFRGNIKVTVADGQALTALGWVGANGRPTLLRDAMVTADQYPVGAVRCVRDPDMKGAWCLATSYRSHHRLSQRALRPALGHQERLARHQGSALRHGHGGDRYRFAGPA